MKTLLTLIAAMALIGSVSTALAEDHGHGHEHGGDFIVGRSLDGQVLLELPIEEGEEHVHALIEPAALPLTGYAGNDPGFDHLHEDEPGEGIYSLEGGASIYVEIVAIEAGLVLRDPADGSVWGTAAGDQFLLGDEELHEHFVIHAPGAIEGDMFDLELKLIDMGSTGYTDSDVFEVHVEAVPEPASLALLALGVVALARRRDRNGIA